MQQQEIPKQQQKHKNNNKQKTTKKQQASVKVLFCCETTLISVKQKAQKKVQKGWEPPVTESHPKQSGKEHFIKMCVMYI